MEMKQLFQGEAFDWLVTLKLLLLSSSQGGRKKVSASRKQLEASTIVYINQQVHRETYNHSLDSSNADPNTRSQGIPTVSYTLFSFNRNNDFQWEKKSERIRGPERKKKGQAHNKENPTKDRDSNHTK